MVWSRRNDGKLWTQGQVDALKKLLRQDTPTPLAGAKLGKTESAVRSKAFRERLSLNPINRSPYNRHKK